MNNIISRDLSDISIENKIRIQAESSRVRLSEFFIDYDRLRSGYVTSSFFEELFSSFSIWNKIKLTPPKKKELSSDVFWINLSKYRSPTKKRIFF